MPETVLDRETTFRRAMDFIPEGVAVFDSDLRLVSSNQRYSELLNLPARLVAPATPLYDIALFLGRRGDLGEGDAAFLAAQRVQTLTQSPSSTI